MCKEGRNSFVSQVLVGAWHIQTYENKKTFSHMNWCAHTRNESRSPEKHAFLDSSHVQCGERLTDAKDIAGWVRVPTEVPLHSVISVGKTLTSRRTYKCPVGD